MPTVILLHGGVPGGKNSASARLLAELFARAGFQVLSMDLQHYGDRKTELLTTFTEADKAGNLYNQQATYLTWVIQTVKDVGRAYDFLTTERQADPRRVALVGFSRGGQLGMIAAGADRRIAAAALLYSGHFGAAETGHHPAACGANYIGRISPRPLLMVNGLSDADYDREVAVLPLQRLAKQPAEFMWVETGHTVPPEDARPAIVSWLREALK